MAGNEGDSVVRLDIDSLVFSIKAMVPQYLLMPPECCIFKIPVILYRHNKKAFIPDAFSIGPLHHGKRKLNATEKIKANYMQALISRSDSPDAMLREMVSSVMEVENKARECYAEALAYNPEQLVQILVIDGCFLIELFIRKAYWSLREVDDPIFSRSFMLQLLYHDLILLENQVPWMVLEILFDLTKDCYDHENPLIILAMNFFKSIYFSNRIPPRDQVINIKEIEHFVDLFRKISTLSSTDPQSDQCINIECIKHLVDLFRKLSTLSSTLFRKLSSSTSLFRKLSTSSSTLFKKLSSSTSLFRKLATLPSTLFRISSSKENKKRRRGWEFLPSATSLVESGIKFKRGTSQSILEVKYNDGVLEIPPFEIHDITETVFRNLISYEQCRTFCDDRIVSYAILLDSLINTAKDIDILCEHEIIDNWLNPEDAAQLFNKLYHDTMVYYHYTDLCGQVNSFCRRSWPRWRAVLVRNYFNTPWAFLSTLAAVILLLMTLLQTMYTMKK